MLLTATRPGETQTRLGHRQRLLEFDLFGRRERSSQPFLSPAACLLSTLDRDLVGMLGDVREYGDSLGEDLHETAPDEQDLLLPSISLLNPQGPWLEDGHERRVAREDAQLPIGPLRDDELDLAFEQASLNADDPKCVLHYEVVFFFISSPCARASSIVPTM